MHRKGVSTCLNYQPINGFPEIKGQKRSKPSCKSLGSLSQRVTHLYSTSMDANSLHFRMGPPRVSQPQKGHPVGVLTYSNPLPKKNVLKTSKKLKT